MPRFSHFIKRINKFGLIVAVTDYLVDYGRIYLPKKLYLAFIKIRHITIKRYIKSNIQISEYTPLPSEGSHKIIWFLWFQGISDMPPIVRLCYENAHKYCGNAIVNLITSENWANFVTLPDFIIEAHCDGRISNTHFSDVIRMALLGRYGGLWMDATILLTATIPNYIFENKLFCIHHFRNDQFVFAGRWSIFFMSVRDRSIPQYIYNTLINYFSKEKTLIDYFLTDYIIDIGYDTYPQMKKLIDSIPINNVCSHYLKNNLENLSEPKDVYKAINGTIVSTWAHKLTYKGHLSLENKLKSGLNHFYYTVPQSPLVTVAMSIYNVDEFLDSSIRCITSQSYQNLEILLIDDKSEDRSLDIAEKWAKCDKRIRVLKQETNQGLSVSRNRAIKEAKGEYILMLDGDDLFHYDMVSLAVEKAIKDDAEMVIWDYIPFYREEDIPKKILEVSRLNDLADLSLKDTINQLLRRPAFMWVKLIKTSVLRELNIQFTPGLTKQDIPVHWQLVTSLDSIVILPEKLSFYRLQPNATSCRKDKSVFSLAYVMDIIEKYLKSNGIYETYRSEFLRSRLSLLQGMYDFINPELKKDAMLMISERYDSEAQAYFADNRKELTPRTRYFFGSLSGNYFDAFKYNAVIATRNIYRSLKNFIGR